VLKASEATSNVETSTYLKKLWKSSDSSITLARGSYRMHSRNMLPQLSAISGVSYLWKSTHVAMASAYTQDDIHNVRGYARTTCQTGPYLASALKTGKLDRQYPFMSSKSTSGLVQRYSTVGERVPICRRKRLLKINATSFFDWNQKRVLYKTDQKPVSPASKSSLIKLVITRGMTP